MNQLDKIKPFTKIIKIGKKLKIGKKAIKII